MDALESPSYRFDGNSPLPLGMEWVPNPSASEGISGGMWNSVPPGTWSFGISIPSWVTAQPPAATSTPLGPLQIESLGKSSPLILYRVVVTIRSPLGTTTSTRLLRRFSDFLKLHAAVVRSFPDKHIPNPPPRHRLLFVSSNNTLITQRRLALDSWVQQLLEDLEVSRSPHVAAFFDLSEGARSAFLASDAERDAGLAGGIDLPTAEGSVSSAEHEEGDGLSNKVLQAFLAKRKGVAFFDGGSVGVHSEFPTPSPPSSLHRVLSGSSLASMPPGFDLDDRQADDEATSSLAAGKDSAEQRLNGDLMPASVLHQGVQSTDIMDNLADSSLKKHSQKGRNISLGESMRMEGAVLAGHSRPDSESDVSSDLGAKIVEDFHGRAPGLPGSTGLGSEAPSTRGIHGADIGIDRPQVSQLVNREQLLVLPEEKRPLVLRHLSALQRRLQVARADMSALLERYQQEAAVAEFLTRKVKDVEAELDFERRQAAASVRQAVSEREERLVAVEWQLEEERVKRAEAQAALCRQEDMQSALSDKLQALEGEKHTFEEQKDELQQRLASLQEGQAAELRRHMEAAEKTRTEESARLRGEVKVLAKEVKALRRALATSEADAAHAKRQVAAYEAVFSQEEERATKMRSSKERLMHEVQVLSKQLKESAATSLAAESPAQVTAHGKAALGGSAKLAETVEMLSTSDARIEMILAQARLLQELRDWDDGKNEQRTTGASEISPHGGNFMEASPEKPQDSGAQDTASLHLPEKISGSLRQRWARDNNCDKELLYQLIGLLIESGLQRKSVNALLRHAFVSSAVDE